MASHLRSDTFTSSGTWTCPTGVTSVTIECWGAGGGGLLNQGGGGGGAYASSTGVSVTPSSGYTVTVGTSGANTDGGDSSFESTVVAKGGKSFSNGRAGGLASESTGTTTYDGGDGEAGTGTRGGGGSAGDSAAGGDASSGVPGDGGASNGAVGGVGTSPGTWPGGGGGSSSSPLFSGTGASGCVRVTYSIDVDEPVVTGRSWGRDESDTTSRSVTMPSGIVAGEYILICWSNYDGHTPSISSGGWTLLDSTSQSTNVTQGIWYKVAAGSDTATIDTSSSTSGCYFVLRVSGASGAPTTTVAASTGTANPPSHDAGDGTRGHLWIAAVAARKSHTELVNSGDAPSGYHNYLRIDTNTVLSTTPALGSKFLIATKHSTSDIENPGSMGSVGNWVAATISFPAEVADQSVTIGSEISNGTIGSHVVTIDEEISLDSTLYNGTVGEHAVQATASISFDSTLSNGTVEEQSVQAGNVVTLDGTLSNGTIGAHSVAIDQSVTHATTLENGEVFEQVVAIDQFVSPSLLSSGTIEAHNVQATASISTDTLSNGAIGTHTVQRGNVNVSPSTLSNGAIVSPTVRYAQSISVTHLNNGTIGSHAIFVEQFLGPQLLRTGRLFAPSVVQTTGSGGEQLIHSSTLSNGSITGVSRFVDQTKTVETSPIEVTGIQRTSARNRIHLPFAIKKWDVPDGHQRLSFQLNELADAMVNEVPNQILDRVQSDGVLFPGHIYPDTLVNGEIFPPRVDPLMIRPDTIVNGEVYGPYVTQQIVDADVADVADIQPHKILEGDNGQTLVTIDGVPTWVTVETDVDADEINPGMDNQVLVTSGSAVIWAFIVNANVASNANIDVTKLSDGSASTVLTMAGSTQTWATIVNANISNSAGITVTKLAGGASNTVLQTVGSTPTWGLIANVNISSTANIAVTKLAAGSSNTVLVTTSSLIPTWLQITNDYVHVNANIAVTKLAEGSTNTVLTTSGATPTWQQILNQHVSDSAAIEVDKLEDGPVRTVLYGTGSGNVFSTDPLIEGLGLYVQAGEESGIPNADRIVRTASGPGFETTITRPDGDIYGIDSDAYTPLGLSDTDNIFRRHVRVTQVFTASSSPTSFFTLAYPGFGIALGGHTGPVMCLGWVLKGAVGGSSPSRGCLIHFSAYWVSSTGDMVLQQSTAYGAGLTLSDDGDEMSCQVFGSDLAFRVIFEVDIQVGTDPAA